MIENDALRNILEEITNYDFDYDFASQILYSDGDKEIEENILQAIGNCCIIEDVINLIPKHIYEENGRNEFEENMYDRMLIIIIILARMKEENCKKIALKYLKIFDPDGYKYKLEIKSLERIV